LTTALGTATLDDGTPMTAAQAMRLACEARIIPVVLGGNGEVLHQGRARRRFTAAQTYALHARDKHCTAKGCDWPPGLCHAHHDTLFSEGGLTDIEDGRLLCPHHHARAHDPAYDMKVHADNEVTFHRRTKADPARSMGDLHSPGARGSPIDLRGMVSRRSLRSLLDHRG
ncbi:HNH endonuclease signature motif containing protein, partial [Streptomyces rhizosphaericus]|uniref:HNH endonuclease signature motif containing protein n=1 Tax=Streptomyces rhizosphaericus TaxID=114699 RepID=UPI0031D8A940